MANGLLLTVGLALLFGGGELVVRGAVGAARALRVPPLAIGVVVVGFATSTPELVVSVGAAAAGQGGISAGNAVGSTIANLLLILGAAALVRPLVTVPAALRRDTFAMLGSAVLVTALALSGVLGRWQGALLLTALAAYLCYSYVSDSRGTSASARLHVAEAAGTGPGDGGMWGAAWKLTAGLGLLLLGAQAAVISAAAIARQAGISEALIGLTLIAVGTSLPELATSLAAARKGETQIVLGNVIGSNIFNLLGVLGAAAIVRPIALDPSLVRVDLPFSIAVVLLLVPFLLTERRITRWGGGLMIAVYASFVATRFAM